MNDKSNDSRQMGAAYGAAGKAFRARLRDRGFNVVEIDLSELQKAEAGGTCMSLIAD